MKIYVIALLVLTASISLTLGSSLPRTYDDWAKIRRTCYQLLRTSAEVRERVERRQYDDDAETHCLVRCSGIIAGMYDDVTGTNMEAAATLAEATAKLAKGENGFEKFRTAYEECAAGIKPEDYGDDYCKKSYGLTLCSWAAWRKHIRKL
uniref:Putative salivary odorant binding protein 1 n=1 Tax=Culex tarsalis TaxID=7177 RepID=A0A1Q3FT61_CULTA